MRRRGLAAASLAVTLLVSVSGPALAQAQGEPTQPAGDAGNSLEEITVTAQRRTESLLSVPLAISAMSEERLSNLGQRDISSLQLTTPGMVSSNGAGYVQMFMRGIGNTIVVGADPSVATFVDDVPHIYGSLINSFINVERVEVLKGAQGGLYGRNATGGVINIITRRPQDKFAGDLRVSYGSRETFRGAAYLNVPLGEGLAWNASLSRQSHKGYTKNLAGTEPYAATMFPSGAYRFDAAGAVVPLSPAEAATFFNSAVKPPRRFGNQDLWAVDSKLQFQRENFSLLLAGDYANKSDNKGNEFVNLDPEIARTFAQAMFGSFGITAQLPVGFFGPVARDFDGYRAFRSDASIRDYGASATADLALDGIDLTSITAMRWNETDYLEDQFALSPSIIALNLKLRKRYFYQELRAVSNSDGPFEYLFGASYLKTRVRGNSVTTLLSPLLTLMPTTSHGGVENWSIYAQAGYNFTQALKLVFSGRYIHENNQVTFSSPVSGTASVSAGKFLPAATLSYALADGGTVYARYAKGFKAGGVNTVDPPTAYPSDLGKVFAPEQVDTYEAGVRVPLFDHRAQLTTAIFYNEHEGLQTFTSGNAAHPAIVFALLNAGAARTYGAEVNFDLRASSAVTLGINAGYLNARYKTFANSDDTVFNTFDLSGERMIMSPEWQVGFNGNLDQPLDDRLTLTGAFLLAYTDAMKLGNSTTPGVPDATQDGYWLANARIGLRTSDKRYELSLFADNLFNKRYFTNGTAQGFGRELRWADPRIIGLELKAGF